MARKKDEGFGFLATAAIVGLVGWAVGKGIRNAREERELREENNRRINTPCYFDNGVTQKQFIEIIEQVSKRIGRIKQLSIHGPVVYGTVISQSGISEWSFRIDYNDYGKVTGSYWLTKENKESQIPDVIADWISERIVKLLDE